MGQDQDVWVCSLVLKFALIVLVKLYLLHFFFSSKSLITLTLRIFFPSFHICSPGLWESVKWSGAFELPVYRPMRCQNQGRREPGSQSESNSQHHQCRRRLKQAGRTENRLIWTTARCNDADSLINDQEHKNAHCHYQDGGFWWTLHCIFCSARPPEHKRFFFLFVCFTLRADKYRDSSSAGELLPNSSCVVFRFNFTHLIYIFHIFISNLWTCIKTKTTCLCIQSRLIRYPLTFYDKEGKQVQFYRPNPDHVFSMDTGWKNVFIHDIWRQLDLEALLSTKLGGETSCRLFLHWNIRIHYFIFTFEKN